MKFSAALFSLFALLPAFSFASAGFPSQAIWVSKTAAVEGETLVVSTVVYNSENESLHGTLVFTSDGTRIGAREFEIGSGGSQIHSIEWKPKRGKHRIAASIEGTSQPLSERQTGEIEITVTAPLPPSATERAISTATQVGGALVQSAGTIASSSKPIVLGVAKSIADILEPLRQKGVVRLENYLATAAQSGRGAAAKPISQAGKELSATRKGTTLGTSTENTKSSDISGIVQTAAAGALFVFKNAFIFYPFLAFLFFLVLYLFARRIRRPKKY